MNYSDYLINWDDPFEVGRYDAICGLPIDEDMKFNSEYIRGREVGEKQLTELDQNKE